MAANAVTGDPETHRMSPILSLPPELVGEILVCLSKDLYEEYVLNESHAHTRAYESLQVYPYSWISATYTCRHWRAIALRTPGLWTRIIALRTKCVKAMLTRSKQAPLVVRIGFHSVKSVPNRTFGSSLSAILKASSRIQSLHIYLQSPYTIPTHDPVSLPLLESLVIDRMLGSYPTPTLVLEHPPLRLVHLELTQHEASEVQPMLLPTLKRLKLRYGPRLSSAVLAKVLSSMPLLEELGLICVLPDEPTELELLQPFPAPSVVHLPKLRVLELEEIGGGLKTYHFLKSILFPTNTRLKITFLLRDDRRPLLPALSVIADKFLSANKPQTVRFSITPYRKELQIVAWPTMVAFEKSDIDQPFLMRIGGDDNHDQERIVEAFESLHFREVRSFFAVDVAISAATWTSLAKAMPHIESVCITSTAKHNLFDAISLDKTPSVAERAVDDDTADDDTVPFSKLKTLSLQDSSYIGKEEAQSSILRRLVSALRSRKARGMELETLIIKDGSNGMNQEFADRLKRVVKNLHWAPNA